MNRLTRPYAAGMLLSEREPKPPTPLIRTDDELIDHIQKSSDMKNWYTQHVATMHTMFGQHAHHFSLALAATSPRNRVGNNVVSAIKAIHHIKHGLPLNQGSLSLHKNNLERLRDGIAAGHTPRTIAASFSGPKVGQYARAVMGKHDATPIDMHVSEMLWGHTTPTDAEHRQGREHVTRLAGKLGWTPRQTQAALWAANQRRTGGTPVTYEHYLAMPKYSNLAKRVLSSSEPIHALMETADTPDAHLGSEGIGSLLLDHILNGDAPSLDQPIAPLHGATDASRNDSQKAQVRQDQADVQKVAEGSLKIVREDSGTTQQGPDPSPGMPNLGIELPGHDLKSTNQPSGNALVAAIAKKMQDKLEKPSAAVAPTTDDNAATSVIGSVDPGLALPKDLQ